MDVSRTGRGPSLSLLPIWWRKSKWFNNRANVGKNFDNRNLYGASFAGPILKNKTFFFLLFDGQRDLKRSQATGLTWTDMAKAGIFRYWPGVD